MGKRHITESELKLLAYLGKPLSLEVTRFSEGYIVQVTSTTLKIKTSLYVTARGEVREFKTVDTIVATFERIGFTNLSITFR